MAQRWLAKAHNARTLIMTLGSTLHEVVNGRGGLEVHQALMDAFDTPHDDSRVDGVEVGRDEFAQLWTGIQQGSELPEAAWHKIVLPTVVTFSGPRTQKIHLELVTAQWLAARAAADAVPGYADIAGTLVAVHPALGDERAAESPPTAEIAVRPSVDTIVPVAEDPLVPSTKRRAWVVAAAIVVAAAVVFALTYRASDTPSAMAGTPTPSTAVVVEGSAMQPSALPTVVPSAAQPPPATTDQPPPVSVSAGPASRPPSAPRDLTVLAATRDSVMLSWSAPADGRTGGVAYYRIVQDGADAGWTRSSGATVTGLTPGTRYIFVIVAYNAAGQQSAASSAVTVITASSLASAPPASPSAPLSPQPSPSPPVVLPGSDVPALGGTIRVTCSNRQPSVVRVTPAAGYTVRDVPQPKDQVRVLLVSPDNDSEITAKCDKKNAVAATVKEHSHYGLFQLSTDPLFVDKVRDVVGLYLDPPERALVLCVDEKSQIQALDRSQPVLPMQPGVPERRTHDYLRAGVTSREVAP